MKDKIDTYNYHELMDRSEMISNIFSQYIMSNPTVKIDSSINELAEKIQDDLYTLYQKTGNLNFEQQDK